MHFHGILKLLLQKSFQETQMTVLLLISKHLFKKIDFFKGPRREQFIFFRLESAL